MRDELPKEPYYEEYGIVNFDLSSGPGTHWTAYYKHNKQVIWFDSIGNILPPKEILKYFKNCEILYNNDNYQDFNTYICGHLCIIFLKECYNISKQI